MKSMLTFAAGIAAPGIAVAALVGTGAEAWSDDPTAYDGAVSQLYDHVRAGGNSYLAPDSNENRFAGGTTLGKITVTGYDRLELFDLGTRAADRNFLGVRLSVGMDTYELKLTPNSSVNTATSHYIASINDILVAAGGSPLEFDGIEGGTITETATLDLFIDNVTTGAMIYSSGMDNTPLGPTNPVFHFTPDLLGEPGPSSAKALEAGDAAALSFLLDDEFDVWGFEDRPEVSNASGHLEPDFNDRLFAFRLVPVPEPSVYGWIGVAALGAAIAIRRRRTLFR